MKLRILIFIILICLSIFVCFDNLADPPLIRWDEYTNYRVIADTMESGNSFTLKYEESNTGNFFEKPPLWYWITEVLVRLFGMNNFNLRVVSAISGVGVMVTLFWIGKKISSYWAGVISWLVILLTPHFFQRFDTFPFSTHTFKSADLDALQLFLILLSFNFFINFYRSNHHRIRDMIFAPLFTGLAYLTKGPFALLPGLLCFSFMALQLILIQNERIERFKQIIKLFGGYCLVLFLTAGIWHMLMIYRFGGDFIDEYFLYHTIKRVVDPLEGHGGSSYTYIYYLFNKQMYLFVEVFILSISFLIIRYKAKVFERYELYFPIIGSIFVFIFLTFLQTKIAWYLFYFHILAALVIGLAVDKILRRKIESD